MGTGTSLSGRVVMMLFRILKNQAECMNCLLIGMGEMACYQERCPHCGRIPPDRKDLSTKKIQPAEVLKKFSWKSFGEKPIRVVSKDIL